MMQKILVIEDESTAAAYLRKGLSEQGFVVDLARDGREGLHLARLAAGTGENEQLQYDLIILDWMLPELDGMQVLQMLRSSGVCVPVLLLTARDSVQDRVRGLDHGADDYLIKPFAFSELLARVRTLLRRPRVIQEPTICVGNLTLDTLRRRAQREGRSLDLTAREFALLEFLARHAGNVVSRTLIAEKVWDMNFDPGSNVIDVHIRRLRAKLDDPFDKPLIHTIRSAGYLLEARESGS